MDNLLDRLALSVTRRGIIGAALALAAGLGLANTLTVSAATSTTCPSGQKFCGTLLDGMCCPGVCCNGSVCCTGCCSGTTSTSCITSTSHSLCGADGKRCVGCANIGNVCGTDGRCACCPSGLPDCAIHCAAGQSCVSGVCL